MQFFKVDNLKYRYRKNSDYNTIENLTFVHVRSHTKGNSFVHFWYDKWIFAKITALGPRFQSNPEIAFEQLLKFISTTKKRISNEIIGESEEVVLNGFFGI